MLRLINKARKPRIIKNAKNETEGKPILQMIRFEKAGMRGDGGIIWRIWNPDGQNITTILSQQKKTFKWKKEVCGL